MELKDCDKATLKVVVEFIEKNYRPDYYFPSNSDEPIYSGDIILSAEAWAELKEAGDK